MELIDKVYNMDCLEGMKMIPDGSVDAVICDLPYGTTVNKWDCIIPFDELWREYHRVAKRNATFVLFGAEPFATKLRESNFDEYKYDWIWIKNNSTGFLNANRRPLKKFENICVFFKERGIYNPQGLIYNPKTQRRGSVGNNYGNVKNNAHNTEYENYPSDVLYFSKDIPCLHPTQKPIDLLRYLVLTYTNEGDTVLDNCIGSGTTAMACIREKRHFIGFELDAKYYEIAVGRIAEEKQQLKLNL